MSIGAYILESKDKTYTPISTESFFLNCWQLAIDDLNLDIIRNFRFGVELCSSEMLKLSNEIEMLKKWAKINLSQENSLHLINRIESFEKWLRDIWSKDMSIVVYVG